MPIIEMHLQMSSWKPLCVSRRGLVALSAAFVVIAGCNGKPQPADPESAGLGEAGGRAVVPSATDVPDWVADAVFYQIFPERFRNGDPSNDPTRTSIERWQRTPASWAVSDWTADWYSRAQWEVEMGPDFYQDGVFHRRYGGDLQGVVDRIDYLADLGITAIYFNPIFHARSLHKYDGSTYHHVDAYFGPDPEGDLQLMQAETSDPDTWQWTAADSLFMELLQKAREKGIRIVIDGVWNHTGRDFFAFADLRANQEESAYRDWYIVERFDNPATAEDEFDYKGWWGSRYLPEFADNADGTDLHPGPRQYVFDATRRWMDPDGDGDPSDGIAGWRLDVVPDMPVGFWADWNAYVRNINPEAYTVSEIWDDAGAAIAEGGFSGTMNYFAFALPVKGFLVDDMLPARMFTELLTDRAERYAPANRFALLNLVDSHDTPRIATMIVNDLDEYAEPRVFDYDRRSSPRNNPRYELRKPDERERRIQRMVALLQMTYPGPPMIYYGTEAGMWGADDPDDRMPMVWDDMDFDAQKLHPTGPPRTPDEVYFDAELHGFFRAAITLRRDARELRRGAFEVVMASSEEKTFAFLRTLAADSAIVAFNRGGQARDVPIDGMAPRTFEVRFATTASDEPLPVSRRDDGTLVVTLPPLSGAVLTN